MDMIEQFHRRKSAVAFAKLCTWKPHGAFASALHVRGCGIIASVIRDHDEHWRAYGKAIADGQAPMLGVFPGETEARTAAWESALTWWVEDGAAKRREVRRG